MNNRNKRSAASVGTLTAAARRTASTDLSGLNYTIPQPGLQSPVNPPSSREFDREISQLLDQATAIEERHQKLADAAYAIRCELERLIFGESAT